MFERIYLSRIYLGNFHQREEDALYKDYIKKVREEEQNDKWKENYDVSEPNSDETYNTTGDGKYINTK